MSRIKVRQTRKILGKTALGCSDDGIQDCVDSAKFFAEIFLEQNMVRNKKGLRKHKE